MHSCIYEGQVRHRRFLPKNHDFSYKLYMMYLDLAELPDLFRKYWLWSSERPNLAWFDRRDHHGDASIPLDQSIRDLVQEQSGKRPEGPIRLLTHMRYFGHGFNPVSFYYCFDIRGQDVETIVAEVNNTPWGEQHCYVLSSNHGQGNSRNKQYSFDKSFHVSPFMPMDIEYDWRFSMPGNTLSVHMENHQNQKKIFDATMRMEQVPIHSGSLARVLAQYPVLTIKVVAAIYFQAFRLWRKKIPFFTHPDKKEAPKPAR